MKISSTLNILRMFCSIHKYNYPFVRWFVCSARLKSTKGPSLYYQSAHRNTVSPLSLISSYYTLRPASYCLMRKDKLDPKTVLNIKFDISDSRRFFHGRGMVRQKIWKNRTYAIL